MAQSLPLKGQRAPNNLVKVGYNDVLTGKYNFQLSEPADLRDTAFYEVILFLWTHLLGFI